MTNKKTVSKTAAVLAAVMLAGTALCTPNMGVTAFADDYELEAEPEEVSVYDEIRRGEGYYVCHISYRGGVPKIYDDDGVVYDLIGEIGGKLQAENGETKESVEKDAVESIRESFVSMGVDPDDYEFDVYTYFYDDYDYTPEEFLAFVDEDILRRDSERDTVTAEVPNPVTGTGLPHGAAAFAVLSGTYIFLNAKKKYR